MGNFGLVTNLAQAQLGIVDDPITVTGPSEDSDVPPASKPPSAPRGGATPTDKKPPEGGDKPEDKPESADTFIPARSRNLVSLPTVIQGVFTPGGVYLASKMENAKDTILVGGKAEGAFGKAAGKIVVSEQIAKEAKDLKALTSAAKSAANATKSTPDPYTLKIAVDEAEKVLTAAKQVEKTADMAGNAAKVTTRVKLVEHSVTAAKTSNSASETAMVASKAAAIAAQDAEAMATTLTATGKAAEAAVKTAEAAAKTAEVATKATEAATYATQTATTTVKEIGNAVRYGNKVAQTAKTISLGGKFLRGITWLCGKLMPGFNVVCTAADLGFDAYETANAKKADKAIAMTRTITNLACTVLGVLIGLSMGGLPLVIVAMGFGNIAGNLLKACFTGPVNWKAILGRG